jgi:hypothetical protein
MCFWIYSVICFPDKATEAQKLEKVTGIVLCHRTVASALFILELSLRSQPDSRVSLGENETN